MNAYLYHCDRYTSNTSSATWTLRQGGIKSHLLTVTDWQAELLVLPGCSKQSLRSWHQARPTFLVMGLVCVISSWKDNLSRSSQLLSECQRLTDATTLSAANISIFIISNVKSGSFVPACAIRELCCRELYDQQWIHAADCSWASICCQALAPGNTYNEKRPDAALIECSPEMRRRQHQLYGEYERLRVLSGTRAKRLTTFSSASVQHDRQGWGGSRSRELIERNIQFHTYLCRLVPSRQGIHILCPPHPLTCVWGVKRCDL